MSPEHRVQRYSLGEEIANSAIHGVGILLAIAGLSVLAVFAVSRGTASHVVSCSIYGATLILLYTASTLYHSIPHPGAKTVLRLLDHSAIFLLIAGTYTPFTLVSLRGPVGWSLFGVIWGLALLGIVLRIALRGRSTWPFIVLYVAMGWAVVLAAKPLAANLPAGGMTLLVWGGILYTAGILFYVWRRLPYHHAIWHGFVLAGSVTHFFAVLLYVIPLARPLKEIGLILSKLGGVGKTP
jgi:hemolysin III